MKTLQKICLLIFCFALTVETFPCIAVSAGELDNELIFFFEDFEDLEINEKPSELGGISQELIGDFAKVVDDGTGNKVLQIQNNSASPASPTASIINFGKTVSEGVYEFSYKIKFVNHSVRFTRLFNLGNETADTTTTITSFYRYFYLHHEGALDIVSQMNAVDEYCTVTQVVDFGADNYHYLINGDWLGANYPLSSTSIDRVTTELFYDIQNEATNGNLYESETSSRQVGTYYIDDIKAQRVGLSITSINAAKGSANVDIYTPINVEFSHELDESTVNSENVDICVNGEILPKDKYNTQASGKNASIEFIDGMEYDSEYKIIFGENIKPKDPAVYKIENFTITEYHTQSMLADDIGVINGGKYTAPFKPVYNIGNDILVEYKLVKDGAEITDYDEEDALETGEYVLTITAVNIKNGKRQIKEYRFSVIGAVAPYAENVIISGEPVVGGVFTAQYEWHDDNEEDTEGESVYQWYRKNSQTGEFTPIENANELTYTLTENDIDCEIKFTVIPKSVAQPYGEREYESNILKSAFRPAANNVKAENINGTINLTYDYYDVNGFEEDKENRVYAWYRMDSEEGEKVIIDGACESSYTLGENDVNKFIVGSVIPAKVKEPSIGIEYFSNVVKGAFQPKAENAEILGKATVGNSVGISYDYYDENGDLEGATEFVWYVGENVVSHDKAVTLTKDMEGKEIYCVVTPVSVEYPYKGDSIQSNRLKVTAKSSSAGGGGGGGGGGIYIPIKEPKPEEETENDVNTGNEKDEENEPENTFSDIYGHWAEENIKQAYNMGIINGVTDTQFCPDKDITRAEISAIIVRMLNLETTDICDFSDIYKDDWYYYDVCTVNKYGFMKGYDNLFRPNDNITREEICSVIMNILNYKGITKEINQVEFSDKTDISSWAEAAVDTVSGLGIVNGRGDGIFAPKESATRAECVTILLKTINILEGESI